MAMPFIFTLKLFGKRRCLESLVSQIIIWGSASGSALMAAASQAGLVVKYLYVPPQGSILWPGRQAEPPLEDGVLSAWSLTCKLIPANCHRNLLRSHLLGLEIKSIFDNLD